MAQVSVVLMYASVNDYRKNMLFEFNLEDRFHKTFSNLTFKFKHKTS